MSPRSAWKASVRFSCRRRAPSSSIRRPRSRESRSFFWRGQATRSASCSWRFPSRSSCSMPCSMTGSAPVRTARGTSFRCCRCSWRRLPRWFRTARTPARRIGVGRTMSRRRARAATGGRRRFLTRRHRGRPAAAIRTPRRVSAGRRSPSMLGRSFRQRRPVLHALIGGHAGGSDHRAGPFAMERVPFGLDFWWVQLFHLGVLPRTAALSAGLLPLLLAAWLLRRSLAAASAVDRGIERSGVVG